MSCQNIEQAVQCVKILTENNRCELCDNIEGARVRYSCGHAHCEDCVVKTNHCLLCLTPPAGDSWAADVDRPATLRAQNAFDLLNAFQKNFRLDVFKKSRLSEQLKLEKNIFPDCIQAPVKYFNKRKSLIHNKENFGPTHFPGEILSPDKTRNMENSFEYIHKWLDKNENSSPIKKTKARVPLGELNVNSPLKRAHLILKKAQEINGSKSKKVKKYGFKSVLPTVNSQSVLDQYWKPPRNGKRVDKIRKSLCNSEKKHLMKKTDKDESGIVIDDPIVIDDSQSIIDKDKQAWLAVLEADEKDPYLSTQSQISECSGYKSGSQNVYQSRTEHKNQAKVPFYKKSSIFETCELCNMPQLSKVCETEYKTEQKTKDLSITIECNKFITTIQMSTVPDKPPSNKQSRFIQTDVTDLHWKKDVRTKKVKHMNQDNTERAKLERVHESLSQDLFTAEVKKQELQSKSSKGYSPNKSQIIIADSDSDDTVIHDSSTIEVTADIHDHSHNSKLKKEVLEELGDGEVCHRNRRCGRGRTPNSSDSSDKENFDPNKAKRPKLEKKLDKTKVFHKDFDSMDYLSDEF